MATIKQDIKENFRDSMEQNTGIVGQVLKDRREKQQHDKEVAAELSKINVKTSRLKNDGSAFKKIELSTIQISENLQIINKWADAQVTTYEETHQALKQQQEEAAVATQSQKLAQPSITIPDPKEDGSIFDSILNLFGNLGKKIKTKFPKIPKGNVPKGKGKFNVVKQGVKQAVAFFGRNAAPIAKVGVAGAGVGALLYSGGLNTNEQEELERRRNLPPTVTQKPVDYSVPPPTGAIEANAKTAAKASALEAAKIATAQPLPPLLPSAPAAPPPVAATIATTVVSQGGGRSGTAPGRAPAAAATAPAPSVSASPTPMAAPMTAGKQEATSSSSSISGLSSVAKSKDSSVKLGGLNPEFEKRVSAMANAFKEETGQKIKITDAMREEADQQKLWDAIIAANGGEAAVAAKGGGNLLAGARALGLTYKVSPPPSVSGKAGPHMQGLAIDFQPQGIPGALNNLAGQKWEPAPDKKTPANKTPLNNPKESWLEKFGLSRPVPGENWHVQLSGTPPKGDDAIIPARGGSNAMKDASTGKPLLAPTDPTTGQKLVDSSKTVAQLKQEQNARGTQTVVMTETTNVTEYERKKKPQGQTTAAVG